VKHKASRRRRVEDSDSSNDDATQLTTATSASTSTATTAAPADAADKETESCRVCLVAPRDAFTLVPCGHARFCESYKPNSITLASSEIAPNMFGASKLVRSWFEAEIWPIIQLASSELARASRFAAKFHYASWFGAGSEHVRS